jgi:hypothetical protein
LKRISHSFTAPECHGGEQNAERGGQLDPHALAAQSVGVLIRCPSSIAGKLP